MRNEKNRLKCDSERFREVLLVLLHCARSSLTLTRAVQRPVQGFPGRGAVLRHSAAQISVIVVCESVGLSRAGGCPWFRLITVAAAPRFGAMWLLCCPGIFFRPFHPLTRIKKRTNSQIIR